MPTPKAMRVELSEAERAELTARLRRRKVARGDAVREEIVLLAADGMTNQAIAERLGITRVTVTTWRKRFAEQRLDGLLDGWKHCFQPSWRAADRQRREDRRGGDGDTGEVADRPDALEFARHGQGLWPGAVDGAAHLEGVLAATASGRDLQALDRSAVRRQGRIASLEMLPDA